MIATEFSNLAIREGVHHTLGELSEDLECLSEAVAEDANEAALYGDGPCGSMARAHAYHRALHEYRGFTSWLAALTPRPPVPPFDPNECPF